MTINMQCAVLAVILACGCAPTLAGEEEQAVKKVMEAYEQAWSRHDGGAVASFYSEDRKSVV